MDWKAITLGEICHRIGGIIQTGPFGSQLHQSDYSQDGIPLVMPKDVYDAYYGAGRSVYAAAA